MPQSIEEAAVCAAVSGIFFTTTTSGFDGPADGSKTAITARQILQHLQLEFDTSPSPGEFIVTVVYMVAYDYYVLAIPIIESGGQSVAN